MASDFTDGLCEKAAEIVFTYLRESYSNPDNYVAREKMHNASTIAGMAFANAFLGINHSLAHKIGAEFHLSHGRTNAVLLPYVIKYNSQMPTKFVSFPKYEFFVADKRYALLAKKLGFKFDTTQEGIDILIKEIIKLNDYLNIPRSFKECGLNESEFMSKLDTLADNAFEDQCTVSNPRQPFVSELKQIMIDAYYGNL
jgi:acetaldehyde dehydrogenase/alcohol dehydrogenase